MRILLQRVQRAAVRVRSTDPDVPPRLTGEIGVGMVLLVGIAPNDGPGEIRWCVDKLAALRIFPDASGKLNRDIREVGGAFLVVSQFTLYGDVRKGRRPSFIGAAEPNIAESIYKQLVTQITDSGIEVQTGEFGAAMEVELVNDGPVTLWIERESPRAHADEAQSVSAG
jgi:D-tyrosyl-tRNA(Tyr) deacylase